MGRRNLNLPELELRFLRLLRTQGAQAAGELPTKLGVSQATLSRLVSRLSADVASVGKARARQYVAKRLLRDLPETIPFYEIMADGNSRQLGLLQPVHPKGFAVEGSEIASGVYADLPYFFADFRPAGYLGRLVPKRHPELSLPDDVRHWSGETTLRYLCRYGWDNPGSIIVGAAAFERYLAFVAAPPELIQPKHRAKTYPRLAADVLNLGVAGSSAAGEQPKFTASVGPIPVLVKFSPPVSNEVAERVADLLVCEHLALTAIAASGQAAAASRLLEVNNQMFLEVDRFDRTREGGRRGVFSLAALDAQFVGDASASWSASVQTLSARKHVPRETLRPTRWLELFSKLIGNTDRHQGNLSFFAVGLDILSLAPAYDISPTLFSPQGMQLVERPFLPQMPAPDDADLWPHVWPAASSFWDAAAHDTRISAAFRAQASRCCEALLNLKMIGAKLPSR